MHRALATIWSNLETNIFKFDFLSSVPFRLMIVMTMVCILMLSAARRVLLAAKRDRSERMKVEPIHHVPMRTEYKSPFSAAYSIEGGRLIFFSGCCTVPTYHKHPHDPDDERQWLAGDFREQTERTFVHIKEILDAAGAKIKDVMKLTIFTTQMDGQNILNEISARYFGNDNPPARSLIGVPTLAHPGMLIEIEGVAAAPAKA
jgi:enamine deaminase RidA (YjgF/YER057c/UK114 family)